jgi:hypothetical protein
LITWAVSRISFTSPVVVVNPHAPLGRCPSRLPAV